MRASLIHDWLYQLIQAGQLASSWRAVAHRIFYNVMLFDGVFPARASLFFEGVSGSETLTRIPERAPDPAGPFKPA
jgi:hypothetical protein